MPLLRTALWLSSLMLLAGAETSVHILSKYGNGQLVTSSILHWIPHTQYSATKNFVIGGFEIVPTSAASESSEPKDKVNRPIFVCRAMHNGNWVAGGQKQGDKRCNVSLTGSVGSYEHYQLLENVDKAARISWEDWTKLYQTPVGAVATSKFFVARHAVEPDRYCVGTLDSQEGLGTIYYVKEDGSEGQADSGQVLVETEPVSYELSAVKLNQQKRSLVKREERLLGQATIANAGSSPASMAEAFAYSYQRVLYWGQVPAMIKNLDTSISLLNKTRLPDIHWGIALKENRTDLHTVEVELEPGTAVNVTLRGYYTELEVPYSGKLHSHYRDGVLTNPRTIGGVRYEASMADVAADFGPVYYLANFSLVPTTAPPPTSTSAQPPTTERDRDDKQYSRESAALDENAILQSKRLDGMQGDDGGPLSLKDKDKDGRSAAARLPLLPLLAALTLLVSRVT